MADSPERDDATAPGTGEGSRCSANRSPPGASCCSPLAALGEALLERRQFADALTTLRQARDIFDKQPPTTKWLPPDVSSLMGAALAGNQEHAPAETALVSGYEGLRDTAGSPRSRLRKSIERLVAFYVAVGRAAEAAPWRARLQATTAR